VSSGGPCGPAARAVPSGRAQRLHALATLASERRAPHSIRSHKTKANPPLSCGEGRLPVSHAPKPPAMTMVFYESDDVRYWRSAKAIQIISQSEPSRNGCARRAVNPSGGRSHRIRLARQCEFICGLRSTPYGMTRTLSSRSLSRLSRVPEGSTRGEAPEGKQSPAASSRAASRMSPVTESVSLVGPSRPSRA
jgi:hypothetical protein